MSEIILECIKTDGKLRIRIVSTGYYPDANCQFPRDLREVGRKYSVKTSAVCLITSRGKYYYSVKQRSAIRILDPDEQTCTFNLEAAMQNLVVYEDSSASDCTICMENPKSMVLIPCGHFYTCNECSIKLLKCPICRCEITERINKTQMG